MASNQGSVRPSAFQRVGAFRYSTGFRYRDSLDINCLEREKPLCTSTPNGTLNNKPRIPPRTYRKKTFQPVVLSNTAPEPRLFQEVESSYENIRRTCNQLFKTSFNSTSSCRTSIRQTSLLGSYRGNISHSSSDGVPRDRSPYIDDERLDTIRPLTSIRSSMTSVQRKKAKTYVDKCAICGFAVGIDRVTTRDDLYHTSCFKCTRCDVSLSIRNYRKNGMDGQLYCEKHATSNQPTTSDENEAKNQEQFFDSLARIQGKRLNDQRCALPAFFQKETYSPKEREDKQPSVVILSKRNADETLLKKILTTEGPYPMIVMPEKGGYWIEECGESSGKYELKVDDTTILYRNCFLGKEHFNYYGVDDKLGPLVVSVKRESNKDSDKVLVILRMKRSTVYRQFSDSESLKANTKQLVTKMCSDITTDKFTPVLYHNASQRIVEYDEHVKMKNYKIGVIYQKKGQCSEEEIFGNSLHTPEYDHFLKIIGRRIKLKDFEGYRGGLDTNHCHTGEESVYTEYEDKHIMFHVSTLLPHDFDPQQLQRKRHIGNDIIAIVFQEPGSVFVPTLIASNFLHAFIIVQPVRTNEGLKYRIAVSARDDVPPFEPNLPTPSLVPENQLRDFIITKLINGENACYKAQIFAKLGERTRSELLETLYENLHTANVQALGPLAVSASSSSSTLSAPPSAVSTEKESFFVSVKRALGGSKRSQSVDSNLANSNKKMNNNNGFVSPPLATVGESDKPRKKSEKKSSKTSVSSETSNEDLLETTNALQNLTTEDSDTGMESMSSSETPRDLSKQLEELQKKLKRVNDENNTLHKRYKYAVAELKRYKESERKTIEELEQLRSQMDRIRSQKEI
ncbi:DgyrCDS4408 [Dimorphilus gyrociliatus]|uniref:DgyrCDS4408 n=1 Tax=Dimorphilus gyrociliatus TaxID=2664684 RepID=A0A7I8VGG8_9ANNE|nr:DgyrCDS4408 [Dimorphilus gyrociliatus]